MDADTQAALDTLGKRIEELAALHAADAPAEKIEAKEEQVEAAAERAGLSDEDADKLADRISAKLAASLDPDALAGKVAANLQTWADEPEPGDEELETLAGRKKDEPEQPAAEAEEKPAEKPEEVAPDAGGDPPAHFTERKLADIFR